MSPTGPFDPDRALCSARAVRIVLFLSGCAALVLAAVAALLGY